MILTLPRRAVPARDTAAAAIEDRRHQVAGGVNAGGPRDPDDTPCRPGRRPLWPGGPCLPAHAERELGYDAHAMDEAPPTPEQLALLIEMGRARVPETRRIARAMIAAGLAP